MQLLFSENDSPLHEKTTNQEAMQFDFTSEDKSTFTPPPDIKTTEEPIVVAMMADAALGTAESMEVEEVALRRHQSQKNSSRVSSANPSERKDRKRLKRSKPLPFISRL